MKRINTATKVTDKFGAGKHGFTDGNPTTGEKATALEGSWFDHVQEEISNFIDEQGITLDANDRTQLAAAITAKLANGNYLRGSVSATLTAAFNTTPLDLTVVDNVASFDPTTRSRFKHVVNDTLHISAPDPIPAAGPCQIKLTMDGTGGHGVSWDAKYRIVGELNTDANAVNKCHLEYDLADDVIDVTIIQRAEA